MVKVSAQNKSLPLNSSNEHSEGIQFASCSQNIESCETVTDYRQRMIQKLRHFNKKKIKFSRAELQLRLQKFISKKQRYYEQNSSSSQFICPICLQMLMTPCPTSCGHIFCYKCIDESIIRNQKCPSCRNHIRNQEFIESKPFSQICDYFWKASNQKDQYLEKCKKNEQWLKTRRINQENIKINDVIDVKDTEHIWCKAKVVDIFQGKDKKQLLVHFQGWNEIYNEVINANSQRLAPCSFFSEREDIPRYKLSAPVDNMRSRIQYRDSRDRNIQREGTQINLGDLIFSIESRRFGGHLRNRMNWLSTQRLPTERNNLGNLRPRTETQQSHSIVSSSDSPIQSPSMNQDQLVQSSIRSQSDNSSSSEELQQDSAQQSEQSQQNEQNQQNQQNEQNQQIGQIEEQQGLGSFVYHQLNLHSSSESEHQQQQEQRMERQNSQFSQQNNFINNVFSEINDNNQLNQIEGQEGREVQSEDQHRNGINEDQRDYWRRTTWDPEQENQNGASNSRGFQLQQRNNSQESGISVFLNSINENQSPSRGQMIRTSTSTQPQMRKQLLRDQLTQNNEMHQPKPTSSPPKPYPDQASASKQSRSKQPPQPQLHLQLQLQLQQQSQQQINSLSSIRLQNADR